MHLLIKKIITLEDIARSGADCIYYGASTCWWTHSDSDLQKVSDGGLPRDSAGGVLFIADDVKLFIRLAIANEDRYGKYKMQTFMSSHHRNSFLLVDEKHIASKNWIDYETAYEVMSDSPAAEHNLIGDIEFVKKWCAA